MTFKHAYLLIYIYKVKKKSISIYYIVFCWRHYSGKKTTINLVLNLFKLRFIIIIIL